MSLTGSLVRCETRPAGSGRKKRVLVVDDSITVREVERQLLLHKGYEVSVAVDGVDGWNKVKAGQTTIQEVLRVTQTEEHLKSLLEDKQG